MTNKEITVWGIHAGRTGDADSLFLNKNVIALGWDAAGDLTGLKADREDFKALISKAYPKDKPGSIRSSGGQLFRFIHELKVGDIVVYPSKRERQLHIGQIEGPYQYAPNLERHYPNTRAIKWLKTIPRTAFTQGALYEIGSAMSFFQVKTYADEFIAAVEEKQISVTKPEEDSTIGYVVEEIEQSTRDFIIKRLAQQLKGHPMEHFVGHLLEAMGYRVRISSVGTDSGIDIIAHKDELGFEPPIVKVQIKSTEGSVGGPDVSALYGHVGQGEFGLLVTLGTFTPQAISYARSKSNLRLIDGNELVDLILQHYEQFDSRYKGLLPLKRVYIPEILEESE